jgi:Swiss Army Knife protein, DSP-PTPase phosphatase domain
MKLVEPGAAASIPGIKIPKEFYWVLGLPAPLAGMKFPSRSFPWQNIKTAGFEWVVSLHPGTYDPSPLKIAFSEHLEDLILGRPPRNETRENEKIMRAVAATTSAVRLGEGVVVHCWGGRGRTGTVIGCVLRELGFKSDEVISFLDRLHKARSTRGWPEANWQSSLVRNWAPDD